MKKKKCTKCDDAKPFADFYANKSMSDGYMNECKVCVLKYFKSRRNDSVIGARIKERKKIAHQRKYCENPEYRKKLLSKNKIYRQKNPEKTRLYSKKYNQREEVKKRSCQNTKAWRAKNPEKDKETQVRARKKRALNFMCRISNAMGTGIWEGIKKKKAGRHWESLVGYTLKDLRCHLERQFAKGMIWENYGKWHIDHKTPISFFVFDSPTDVEFRYCWSLDNLQPLWAKDNMSKSNKIIAA